MCPSKKTTQPRLFKAIASTALILGTVICNAQSDADLPYIEHDGIVIFEAEDTTSDLGLWLKKSTISDYTGTGYLEFNGNGPTRGDPNSPIEYKFFIKKGGLYYLNLLCAKEVLVINGETRTDIANDGYVRVEGNYESGPNPGDSNGLDAPLSMLKSDTKFFGGSANRFSWSYGNKLDPGGTANKRVAIYNFKSGEEYTLVVSGRSQFFKIDRFMFRHKDVALETALDTNLPASSKVPQLAHAGEDQSIYITAGSIVLDGSQSIHDDVASYLWTQLSGPSDIIISDTSIASPTTSSPIIGVYTFRLDTTNGDGEVTSDEVAVLVLPDGEDLAAITSFTLINGETHLPIPEYDPIPNGAIINIAEIDTGLYSIRTNSVPDTDFGSVTTVMDGPVSSSVTDTTAPWSLLGYASGNYRARPFQVGEYTVSATPYGETNSGLTGTPLSINFSFIDEPLPKDNKLYNISTRAMVGTGNDVIIAGFFIDGEAPKTVLIQGVGKELATLDPSIEDLSLIHI